VARGFAGVRAAAANARAGDALRRWRTPQGQEGGWRKILTGEGNIGFNEAAALVTFADTRRLAQHAFTSRLNAEAQAAVSEAAGTFGRERTGNRALSELIHQAETQGGTPINRIFDAALEMMREVGITRPGRKNYVPHQITEGALQWLRSDASPEARYIRETFFGGVNLDDISPSMMERRLVPGADPDKPFIINGKEFYIREGTIKEMNEQFAKLVPNAGFKFFEDDFSTIIARYSKSMAEDVGMVAGARRLIN